MKEYSSIRNLKNKNKTQAYTFYRDRLLLIVLAEILSFFKHEEQNSRFHLYNEISPGRKKEFTIATGKNMDGSANNDARSKKADPCPGKEHTPYDSIRNL